MKFKAYAVSNRPADAYSAQTDRSRRLWRVAILSVAITVFLIAGALRLWQSRYEPAYRGKALRVWLQTYAPSSSATPSSPEWHETDNAVRQLGTNCLPVLLRMIRHQDWKLKLELSAFARKRGLIKARTVPASEKNIEASRAFIVLGSTASDAVPALVKMYDDKISAESRIAIANALSWIGPEARSAVPMLLRAATNSDPRIKASALWALGEIRTEPQQCVPRLIKGLCDSNSWVRLCAAHAAGRFGSDAESAVPFLIELTNHRATAGGFGTDIQANLEARIALEKINQQSTTSFTGAFSDFDAPIPDFSRSPVMQSAPCGKN